jgi:hypothetical protein
VLRAFLSSISTIWEKFLDREFPFFYSGVDPYEEGRKLGRKEVRK